MVCVLFGSIDWDKMTLRWNDYDICIYLSGNNDETHATIGRLNCAYYRFQSRKEFPLTLLQFVYASYLIFVCVRVYVCVCECECVRVLLCVVCVSQVVKGNALLSVQNQTNVMSNFCLFVCKYGSVNWQPDPKSLDIENYEKCIRLLGFRDGR